MSWLWFRSDDRGSCTDNRSVHWTHRCLLFLTARYRCALDHRVRHILGWSNRLDDRPERVTDRRGRHGADLRHCQQHSRYNRRIRSRSGGHVRRQLHTDSTNCRVTGYPATSSTIQPHRFQDIQSRWIIYRYNNYKYNIIIGVVPGVPR